MSTAADLTELMGQMGQAARGAADALSLAGTDTKNRALSAAAAAIRAHQADILSANGHDLARARERLLPILQSSDAPAGEPL